MKRFVALMTHVELRTLRLSLGLTQEAMAARLGIGLRMYAYCEAGTKHLSKASALLAEALKP